MRIKKFEYELKILDGNTASTTTEKITGLLKGLIIESSNVVGVKISLTEYPLITLFNDQQFSGCKLLNLKNYTTDCEAERFNYSSDDYALDDELLITIYGMKESEVKICLRVI